MATSSLNAQTLHAAALLAATSQVFVMDEDDATPSTIVNQLESALQNPDRLTFTVREQYESESTDTLLSLIKDTQDCAISVFEPYSAK